MSFLRDDIDYVWQIDSDEVYKKQDIEKIIQLMHNEKPTSIGVKSCSFYGGFRDYIGGFEEARDNFLRIFKYEKGSTWLTHRPPTIQYPSAIVKKHITSTELLELTDGAQMYHYSYVFPKQVKNKVEYYKDKVSMNKCIDNYFKLVYLPWVLSYNLSVSEDAEKRKLGDQCQAAVEHNFNGVHEFKPEYRGDCYTARFIEAHPEAIRRDIHKLTNRYTLEFEKYKNG